MEARPFVAVADGLAGVSGSGLEACWPLQPEPEPQPQGGTDLIFLWRVSGLARSRGRPPDCLLDVPAVGGQGDSLPEAPPQSAEAVLLPFLGQADPLLHKVSRKTRGTEACCAPASGLLPSPCCCLPARISRRDAGGVASPLLGGSPGPGRPPPQTTAEGPGLTPPGWALLWAEGGRPAARPLARGLTCPPGARRWGPWARPSQAPFLT